MLMLSNCTTNASHPDSQLTTNNSNWLVILYSSLIRLSRCFACTFLSIQSLPCTPVYSDTQVNSDTPDQISSQFSLELDSKDSSFVCCYILGTKWIKILSNHFVGFHNSLYFGVLSEWMSILFIIQKMDHGPHCQVPHHAQQLHQLYHLLLRWIQLPEDFPWLHQTSSKQIQISQNWFWNDNVNNF